ncbi:MAG: phosphomethylpyrimidine synthase ThiC [Nitrospinae bacterium]|nr:phosphomethylpyrimidine synthase ThiC [Nitrospinota bacterium]
MLQIQEAQKGNITAEMLEVAKAENISSEVIRERVANGTVIVVKNNLHKQVKPLGIGKGLSTKINANIGTSSDCSNLELELKKLEVATKHGADTVMDLSTGGDLDHIRKEIVKASKVPLGSVPIYQCFSEAFRHERKVRDVAGEEFIRAVEKHAEDGIDYVTVHCGVTKESVKRVNDQGRILDIVSRGGALTAKWIKETKQENPLYEYYDDLLAIAMKYDLTLSLGDGLRPGCLADATDRGQVQETIILGELAKRALEKGVQVMIEGPGHVPLNEVEANIQLQKSLCNGAPFYVLGPLVTDIAPGYDHITSAIGGAIAAKAGADFLCYVTPAEHLKLPDLNDVKEGVIAAKISAHAGDIAKGVAGAMDRDIALAKARKNMDWEKQIELSLDPEKASIVRGERTPLDEDVCTMCSDLCSIKLGN